VLKQVILVAVNKFFSERPWNLTDLHVSPDQKLWFLWQLQNA